MVGAQIAVEFYRVLGDRPAMTASLSYLSWTLTKTGSYNEVSYELHVVG